MAINVNQSAKREHFASGSLKEAFEEICRLAKAEARVDNRLQLEIVLNDGVYQVYEPLTLSVDEVPELAYVDLTLTVKGCTFDIVATSSVARALIVASSSQR